MKKEFYIGQPLIIKDTGEKVTFAYDNGKEETPCIVLHIDNYFSHQYCDCEELEPSTEFRFSEIMAGLEQRYFEAGTVFRLPNANKMLIVKQGDDGLYLDGWGLLVPLASTYISSTWTLVEPRKEMTLEEIEAELGYKIKLKDHGES